MHGIIALLILLSPAAPQALPAATANPAGSHGAGAPCTPAWTQSFMGLAGADDEVRVLEVFDSGAGPRLHLGGRFERAGRVLSPGLAMWNGAEFEPVGAGVVGEVLALAVHDDGSGSGPALYVGGEFTLAGGQPAANLARWDGTAWSAVGTGTNGVVRAMAVYDDGSGPALYLGGDFTEAGGQSAAHIARWDGLGFASVGSGMAGGAEVSVRTLAVYDDGQGGGAGLFAGGHFETAGGQLVYNLARWNGAQWAGLGGVVGLQFAEQTVNALTVFGSDLYIGGHFEVVSGVIARNVARWDGIQWAPLGNGLTGLPSATVHSLALFDDGTPGGPLLYAGGSVSMNSGGGSAHGLARFDGASWAIVSGGIAGGSQTIHALAVHDDGTGQALFFGGSFNNMLGPQSTSALNIGRWSGDVFTSLNPVLDGNILTLVEFDSGSGPELIAGGNFLSAGGQPVDRLARFDGQAWLPFGGGADGAVHVLASFDLGSGPGLYAGGNFTTIGGVAAARVARWDGQAWSALGAGVLDGSVRALQAFDDGSGSGPALYAAGTFTLAGAASVQRIARWDGSSWSAVGGGFTGGTFPTTVWAMAIYDEGFGAGPQLFAAGNFQSADGNPARRIARWNGTSWSALANGLGGASDDTSVLSLVVHDDGGGPGLFAGGTFQTTAGGGQNSGVARWRNGEWISIGEFAMRSDGLVVHDDGLGDGPVLFSARTSSTGLLRRWDGQGWTNIEPSETSLSSGGIRTVFVHDPGDGFGPSIVIAGGFLDSPAGDAYAARYGGCAPVGPGVALCFGDGSAGNCPCGNPGGAGEGCKNSSGAGAELSGSGTASLGADDLVLSAQGLLPQQPALLFAGSALGVGLPFGDGLRCAGSPVARLGIAVPGPGGAAAWGPGLGASLGVAPGDERAFQVWYRDALGSPCGTNFNLSNSYRVTFEP